MKHLMVAAFMVTSLVWSGIIYAANKNDAMTEHRSVDGLSVGVQGGDVVITFEKEYEYVAIQIQSVDGVSYYEFECAISSEDSISIPICGLLSGDYRIFIYTEDGLSVCGFSIT